MAPDDAYWLLFAHLCLAPARAHELLQVFGGPRGIFEASQVELNEATRRPSRLHHKVREVERTTDLARVRRALAEEGVHIVTMEDSRFPELLAATHVPPPVLFVKGDPGVLSGPSISIVGSRKSSEYGTRIAGQLAADLGRAGYGIVSGLAMGIDSAAHRGALDVGAVTIAVLGCSIEVNYPAQNKGLKEAIVESGAIITEFAPGTRPASWTFPQRNRIVSGLSVATIVVEAPERSGALITARLAGEQGREVMAVPGDIHSGRSRGSHGLLRDGAALVETAEDVLAILGVDSGPKTQSWPTGGAPALSPPEERVLSALRPEGMLVEAIADLTGLGPADVNSSLMLLEMKGRARRLPGGRYASH